MPKSIPVSPEHFRKAGTLAFPQIPLHAYARPFAEERKARGEKALVEILRHMMIIREFETMLGAFKAHGQPMQDIAFAYKGPAHLSIGQEGAAVGAALALDPGRPHLRQPPQPWRVHRQGPVGHRQAGDRRARRASWRSHEGGRAAAHRRAAPSPQPRRRHWPRTSCCFGLLAEIFMRANGFNGGMGGSMHAFFPPFGAYPNNAIVGASAGIATGAALRKKLAGEDGIAVAIERRRLDRLRPGLRGDELRRHGAVRHAVDRRPQGRPAGALLLHQQFLRHGRPDLRRDHGLGPAVADRRRR